MILKGPLIGLAGPLTIIVGALMLVAPLSDLVQLFQPPYTEALWEFFHFQTAAMAVAVMLPAFIGTWLRYKDAAGVAGRLGLILNVTGCGAFCLALSVDILLDVLQLLKHPTGPNYGMGVSIVSILIGHILLGIGALRYKLLPHWNATPLLVGLLFFLLAVPKLFVESNSPQSFALESTIAILQSAAVGLCWLLMGIAMMGPRRDPQPTAVM